MRVYLRRTKRGRGDAYRQASETQNSVIRQFNSGRWRSQLHRPPTATRPSPFNAKIDAEDFMAHRPPPRNRPKLWSPASGQEEPQAPFGEYAEIAEAALGGNQGLRHYQTAGQLSGHLQHGTNLRITRPPCHWYATTRGHRPCGHSCTAAARNHADRPADGHDLNLPHLRRVHRRRQIRPRHPRAGWEVHHQSHAGPTRRSC